MDDLDLSFDSSDFKIKDLGPFGEDKHELVAHALPLVNILLSAYCYLIQICYEPKEGSEHIAEAAEETRHAVKHLLGLMQEKAEAEHPGAAFLEKYSLNMDTYPESKEYPPSIELKNKILAGKSEV